MDITVQVAIIAAAASIIAAVVSFVLGKRADRADTLQQRKFEHYHELLSAISDAASDPNLENQRRVAHSVNRIALVAPQEVIAALMNFLELTMSPPRLESAEGKGHFQSARNRLLIAIRQSLELPYEDDPSTFDVPLIKLKQIDDA